MIHLTPFLLTVFTFSANVYAQVRFTNSEYPILPVEKEFKITWSGADSVSFLASFLVPSRLFHRNLNP